MEGQPEKRHNVRAQHHEAVSDWLKPFSLNNCNWCVSLDIAYILALTFGAVTTEFGNSFHSLVILTGKDCRLKFNF